MNNHRQGLLHGRLLAWLILCGVAAFSGCKGVGFPLARRISKARQRRAESKTTPEAAQILERVSRSYAQCAIYRDTGESTTRFHSAHDHTSSLTFSTAFRRTGDFRYEFISKGLPYSRYIVWRRGTEIKSWWSLSPPVERHNSLDYAIAGPTGISSGTAHNIPRLLMNGEITGSSLTSSLEGATRAEDVPLDGIPRMRISGFYFDSPTTLWLDSVTLMILRIDSATEFDDFTTEDTILYHPVCGGTLDDSYFVFESPDKNEKPITWWQKLLPH